MKSDIITTQDINSWLEDLNKITTKETWDEIKPILQGFGKKLLNYSNLMKNIKEEIEKRNNIQDFFIKYQNITYNFGDQNFLKIQKENFQEELLYKKLLYYMTNGYYLLTNLRDILVKPIHYKMAYKDPNTQQIMITKDIEQQKFFAKTVFSLVYYKDDSFNSSVRLQGHFNELYNSIEKNELNDDLYIQINNYIKNKKHTYYNKEQKKSVKVDFQPSNVFEAWRFMHRNNLKLSPTGRNFHTYYEIARKGNLAYYKGGDNLNEQNKYGQRAFLSRFTPFIDRFEKIGNAMQQTTQKQIYKQLKTYLIQEIKDKMQKNVENYIKEEQEALLTILKINKK